MSTVEEQYHKVTQTLEHVAATLATVETHYDAAGEAQRRHQWMIAIERYDQVQQLLYTALDQLNPIVALTGSPIALLRRKGEAAAAEVSQVEAKLRMVEAAIRYCREEPAISRRLIDQARTRLTQHPSDIDAALAQAHEAAQRDSSVLGMYREIKGIAEELRASPLRPRWMLVAALLAGAGFGIGSAIFLIVQIGALLAR